MRAKNKVSPERILDGDLEKLPLKEQLDVIKVHFEGLRRENQAYLEKYREFLQRHEEIERQNENLLNLFVTESQLHASLDKAAVLTSIQEVLLNLVGAEVFTLWLVDPRTGDLRLEILRDEEGMMDRQALRLPPGLRKELAAGGSVFGEGKRSDPEHPLACVPLLLAGGCAGAICLYRLLTQKPSLTDLDREILGLLSHQAAPTLVASTLFAGLEKDFPFLK